MAHKLSMTELQHLLLQALDGACSQAAIFAHSGTVQSLYPGLHVDGVGAIGLPLTEAQADAIRAQCQLEQDGTFDGQLSPSHVSFSNPGD